MSVYQETCVEIVVPTKFIAKRLAANIAHDYESMTVEVKIDAKKKSHLYLDGEYVFSEPGE